MGVPGEICQAGEGTEHEILRAGVCSVGDGSGVGGARGSCGCSVAGASSWAVASGEFVSWGD